MNSAPAKQSKSSNKKAPLKMNISIITTCKSRLSHLKQVIDSWIDFNPSEIIVVDVDCPDGTSEWLAENYPSVRCVSVAGTDFNLAKARNAGASSAAFDYLFFVDADIHLGHGLRDWLEANLRRGFFYKRVQNSPYEGIHEQGTCICHRSDFTTIHGYDETFSGYGGEDLDIYFKFKRIGRRLAGIPQEYIKSLEHSDELRTQFYEEKNKFRQSVINRSYAALKEKLLENQPQATELPKEVRERLWRDISSKMPQNFDNLETDLLGISYGSQKWLPEPYFLEVKHRVEIKVRRKK